MKNLIRKILREQLEGGKNNPLSEKEIRIFKYVNKVKPTLTKKSEYLDLFKTLMKVIGKPESDARFYYEIYVSNYRPEGDYENLDNTTFKNIMDFKQRKIPNTTAFEYTSAKMPFKGSNLEGFWNWNEENELYYIVTSYNWYPIYLFINNKWYRVSNTYSSSTAKHISHANPFRKQYDPNIKNTVTIVTPDELREIRDGKPMEDIKSNRVILFMQRIGNELNNVKPSKMITFGWGEDKKKVKYTIKNVRDTEGKVRFTIDIDRAGTVEGTNKMVINPEGYIVPSPFSEDIEDGIKTRIIDEYRIYLNPENTTFIFQHPKK